MSKKKKTPNKTQARVALPTALRRVMQKGLPCICDIRDLAQMLYNHDLPQHLVPVLIFALTLEENTDLFGLIEAQQMICIKPQPFPIQNEKKDTTSS